MKNNSKYWIVTDLDGTLMDDNYDIGPAKKTLKMLAEMNIPVIPCTSKTLLKLDILEKRMHCRSFYCRKWSGCLWVL